MNNLEPETNANAGGIAAVNQRESDTIIDRLQRIQGRIEELSIRQSTFEGRLFRLSPSDEICTNHADTSDSFTEHARVLLSEIETALNRCHDQMSAIEKF